MTGYSEQRSYSTTQDDAEANIKTWLSYMGEVYFRLDVKLDRTEGFTGELVKRSFAQTDVSTFEASPQRVIRSKSQTLNDPVESFCLVLPSRGSFEHRQRGGGFSANKNEAYVLNANIPYEVDVADGSKMSCLILPSDLVRDRVRGVDDLCGGSKTADPVMASTLRHLADGALAATPGLAAHRLQDLCLELFELIFYKNDAIAEGRFRYADAIAQLLVEKASAYIQLRLADPDLRIAEVAAHCRVSKRQLQASFKKADTSFGAALMEARLVRAARMLRSSDYIMQQIGSVAVQCGFTSQSHFATRYRQRFGHSPSSERR